MTQNLILARRPGAQSTLLLITAACAALFLGGCERRDTLLTVHASATTRTAPDLAIVTLGVVARGATARAAQQAQSLRMETVMSAVRAASIEDGEVQTVGYSIEPQYTYPRGGPPRITGYQSRNTVTIRVRNLGAVSGLIDATVADGANELHGIQFTYQDDEASHNAARAQALQVARTRATAYAEAEHMRVARVLSITEPGGALPPWDPSDRRMPPPMAVAAEQAANGAAIAPGELENRSSVTVVYLLK